MTRKLQAREGLREWTFVYKLELFGNRVISAKDLDEAYRAFQQVDVRTLFYDARYHRILVLDKIPGRVGDEETEEEKKDNGST